MEDDWGYTGNISNNMEKYHGIWNITSGKHLKITVERSTHFYHGKTPYFNGHFQ